MTPRLKNMLENYINSAIAYGLWMKDYPCAVESNGHYVAAPQVYGTDGCHPLETVILGSKIKDCINVEIANALGVHLQWIDGFVDGYSGRSGKNKEYMALPDADSAKQHYLEGFQDGEEIGRWVSSLDD